jgi:hypothetical protein
LTGLNINSFQMNWPGFGKKARTNGANQGRSEFSARVKTQAL